MIIATSILHGQADLMSLQEMTPEAEIVNVRFHKSVIASKEAFTYQAAQNRKDDQYVLTSTALE